MNLEFYNCPEAEKIVTISLPETPEFVKYKPDFKLLKEYAYRLRGGSHAADVTGQRLAGVIIAQRIAEHKRLPFAQKFGAVQFGIEHQRHEPGSVEAEIIRLKIVPVFRERVLLRGWAEAAHQLDA